jgi:hypothetical protein
VPHAPRPLTNKKSGLERLFEEGDTSGYLAAVAKSVTSVAVSGDVVLLDQASMAQANQLIERADILVLNSPRLGVEAAFAAYRGNRE